ncbi:MAG: hypothetical protein JKY34_02210 [Kordiimonadaceae bacterium]|nr:hypothetical protein [Kordiimonadaceae bacterium]
MRYDLVRAFLFVFLSVAHSQITALQAQDEDLEELDLAALLDEKIIPANVLGTHTHMTGEWMVGYTYMLMPMEGMASGTQKLSNADVLQNYMVTPTSMDMQMHMFHVMYAPTDDLTLMGMAGYRDNSMDHITRMGTPFTTTASGFGDIKLGGIYHAYRKGFDKERILLSLSVSLPTGSISKTDFLANPAIGKKLLPYPMQLGSGTFDLHPGIKYINRGERSAWGADLDFTLRLGKNSHEYALGNSIEAKLWYRYQLNDWLAPFLQIDAKSTGRIKGRDPALNSMLVPTADPDNQGGKVVYLQSGFNIFFQGKTLDGQRLAVEFLVPIHQDLNGIQLRTRWHLRGGWQWVF